MWVVYIGITVCWHDTAHWHVQKNSLTVYNRNVFVSSRYSHHNLICLLPPLSCFLITESLKLSVLAYVDDNQGNFTVMEYTKVKTWLLILCHMNETLYYGF